MPCRIQPWVKPSCCTWELSLCPDLSPCLSLSHCALLQARLFPPPTLLSALPELYLKYWEVLLEGIFLAWFRKSGLALSFLVYVFLSFLIIIISIYKCYNLHTVSCYFVSLLTIPSTSVEVHFIQPLLLINLGHTNSGLPCCRFSICRMGGIRLMLTS